MISVLLPTYNEARHIENCITRILTNGYPASHIEILVIDGGSNDGTREIVEAMRVATKQIQVFDNPRRLPYPALNIGLAKAAGSMIMRVDARSVIPDHYIETLYETSQKTNADNVGGLQKPIVDGSIWKQAIAHATMSVFGTGGARFRCGGASGYVDTVYLGFFKREIFDKVGKFDEEGSFISEDSMFNKRIIDAGGKVYLNSDMVILYHGKDSLAALARQYFIYGAAKYHSTATHKKFTAWRQYIPLASMGAFYLHLIGIFVFPKLIYSLVAGLTLYGAATLTASLVITVPTKRPRFLLPLLLIFPTIHFSWANGFFLHALLKKRLAQIFKRE